MKQFPMDELCVGSSMSIVRFDTDRIGQVRGVLRHDHHQTVIPRFAQSACATEVLDSRVGEGKVLYEK